MELLISIISIPIMLGIAVIITYYMMYGIFWLFEKHDTWNRGDHC